MNIVLIGFKNCGKTSVGKLLAKTLDKHFLDTDTLIKDAYAAKENKKLTVREIYIQQGEHYFRELEKNIIANLNAKNSIIATGGGSVLDRDNVKSLKKNAKIIYLAAPFKFLQLRYAQQSAPAFLDKEQTLFDYYQARKEIYKKIADIVINIKNKSVVDIVNEIVALFRKNQTIVEENKHGKQ